MSSPETSEIQTFKTIETGGDTVDELINELKKPGEYSRFRVKLKTENFMRRSDFSVPEEKEKFEVVVVNPGFFGFKKMASLEEVYQAAKDTEGLELPPAYVAPYLRLAYNEDELTKQPALNVCHEPIPDPEKGYDRIFTLTEHKGAFYFNAVRYSPSKEYYPGNSTIGFVFVRP